MDTYETITYSLYTNTKDLSYKNGICDIFIHLPMWRLPNILYNYTLLLPITSMTECIISNNSLCVEPS